MTTDIVTLHKLLKHKIKEYKTEFGREPNSPSIAKLLSNILYQRRFMPYYTFNLLCGFDDKGEGVIYGYDAIGSFDTINSGIQGSGKSLGCPILDNVFKDHNHI